MRIGCIGINFNTIEHNYGAVLHTWAFQNVLRTRFPDAEIEVIDYYPQYQRRRNTKYPAFSLFLGKKDRLEYLFCLFGMRIREAKFAQFVSGNIVKTPHKYHLEDLEGGAVQYDVFICASDEVWVTRPVDYSYRKYFDQAFFLDFSDAENAKKVFYSVSMADAVFTKEEELALKEMLDSSMKISVREQLAQECCREKLNLNVPCLLDPTLLLCADAYQKIMKPCPIKKKYILLYGPVPFSSEMIRAAREYAREHDYKVVECSRFTWHRVHNKVITSAGIGEFLSLIQNAEAVFTNSFHAVCFCVVFKREFYVFSRYRAMKCGFICNIFGLSNRYFAETPFKEQPPIDWMAVDKKLLSMQQQSIDWLMQAIID